MEVQEKSPMKVILELWAIYKPNIT